VKHPFISANHIRDTSNPAAANPETGKAQYKQRGSTWCMNCNGLPFTEKHHRIQPPLHHKPVRSTEIKP
jgi:hypothetical protein